MAIPPIGGGDAGIAAPQGAANGAGFDAAVQNAQGGAGGAGGGNAVDQMVESGVQIMGNMMMKMAGDILNEAQEDDEG